MNREGATNPECGCRDSATGGYATSYKEQRVYGHAFELAMDIHALSEGFPVSERFALTDQIRRSSRSVCANLAEAWRKRRYKSAFIAKMSDAETEACETQAWLQFAAACGLMSSDRAERLEEDYEQVLASIVAMIRDADGWLIRDESSPGCASRQGLHRHSDTPIPRY